MTVIAMTREMGTRGKDVALELSVQMELALIHHQLVEQDIAKRLSVEVGDVHRFLEGSPSLLTRWKIDQQRLSRYTTEEILKLAQKGNVIIRGWGAAYLLKDIPHVMRVRICAPMKYRIKCMMDRLGLTVQLWPGVKLNGMMRRIPTRCGSFSKRIGRIRCIIT